MDKPTSITDVSIAFPSAEEILNILTLQGGYNSALVVAGTTLLGIAAGLVGTFALLRKRALMGDALAHSTLPGLTLAFIMVTALGGEGRSLSVLLTGAAISGVLGVLVIQFLIEQTRLPEDAAIGAVLSIFFGVGITLLSIIQNLRTGSEGGLHHFIYGQTAALNMGDAFLLASTAFIALFAALFLLKEFRLVCFDNEFAATQGWPVSRIDLLMMALVVLVTVIGLQSVGLILVVALLIVPSAAARFWTERLSVMTILGGIFGGLSGYLGASTSALLPRLPAGAVIVLTAGGIFIISILFAPSRGVIADFIRQGRLRFQVGKDHLLRGAFEILEANNQSSSAPIPISTLREIRHWNKLTLSSVLFCLKIQNHLAVMNGNVCLTKKGFEAAKQLTKNHRLWEEYLVTFADLPPSHVDPSADLVEHFLSAEILSELEETLQARGRLPSTEMPTESLHPVKAPLGGIET